MKSLVVAENVVSLPTEVADRLEGKGMTIHLTKRRLVREMFSPEMIARLEKDYNLDTMYFEFGICSWDT